MPLGIVTPINGLFESRLSSNRVRPVGSKIVFNPELENAASPMLVI